MKRIFGLIMCLTLLVPFGIGNVSADQTRSVDSTEILPLSSALHVLPPLGNDNEKIYQIDQTLTDFLQVKICQVDGGDCALAYEFTSQKNNKGLDYIKLQNKFYHVNWNISKSDLGKTFELHFVVTNMEVGYMTYVPRNGKAIPIRFQIDDHPIIRCRVLHEQEYSASEIAKALKEEFDLLPFDTTQILADDGFPANEAGLALKATYDLDATKVAQIIKDIYKLNADTTAQILKSIGFSAVNVGQALKDAFELEAQAAAQILKNIGFFVKDIGTALRDVFILDPSNAAQILYDVGFSLVEISTSLENIYALTENQVHLALSPILIEVFGPTIYFHPNELYLISSVEWFLDGTTILENDKGDSEAVFPKDVQNKAAEFGCLANDVDCWFKALVAKRPGQLAGAKTYVHLFHPADYPDGFDLQFWLFYPYNGPGTMYSRIGELWDKASVIDPVGSHSGDWESVIIRFEDDFKPNQVFLSQHGDYPTYLIDALDMVDGTQRLKIYASLNGHANYAAVGNNPQRKVHQDLGLGHLDVDMYNRTSGNGAKFATQDGYEIVALDGTTLPGYEWIEFPDRWGPRIEMYMDSGTVPALLWDHLWPGVLAGCAIVSAACTIGYPVCFAICTGGATAGVEIARDDIIDAIYPGGLISNGPSSPGNKSSWIYDSIPFE